jgi:thiazole synthase
MDGSQVAAEETWSVGGRSFRSRLIIGTGKYKDYAVNAAAAEAAGAEMVTVALRRVNLSDPNQPMLTDFVRPDRFTYVPNTAGCFTGYPDMEETLRALKLLIADGFSVMVYATDDPVMCKKAEDLGAAAIMPAGAPIGSGLGVQNAVNIRLIVEQSSVPVLVDAGVGTASDAALAMELGCDAVLMNTAIAEAKDPIRMARAMKHAVIAGREAYLAGRMGKRLYADPSSPLAGLI